MSKKVENVVTVSDILKRVEIQQSLRTIADQYVTDACRMHEYTSRHTIDGQPRIQKLNILTSACDLGSVC